MGYMPHYIAPHAKKEVIAFLTFTRLEASCVILFLFLECEMGFGLVFTSVQGSKSWQSIFTSYET